MMYKFIKKFNKGVVLIELALVLPILLLLVLGILELGLMLSIKNAMEVGLYYGSRYGITGQAAPLKTRIESIENIVFGKLAAFTISDTSNSTLTITSYSSLANLQSNSSGQAGPGNAGDFVSYQISYTYHLITPLLYPLFGETKSFTAKTVVKNELF